MSTNNNHVPTNKSLTISDLPQDVIGYILCRLPAKDVVQTSVFSRDWKHKWVRWIESHGDRITTLPDQVINHIFSLISMKDVVRTSVLSRIWENKWTSSVYDIDIFDKQDSLRWHESSWSSIDYADVHRVLLRTSRLRSFRLTCKTLPPFGYLKTWISTVLAHEVQNLYITAPANPLYFSCWNSLTNLTLNLNCTLIVSHNNYFPNLKNLHLLGNSNRGIKIVNKCQGCQILLNCPVLEVLELGFCQWVFADSVEIQAPKLIEFRAEHLRSNKQESYEIKIFGPKLATFELTGSKMSNFVLSAPTVTYAVLGKTMNGVREDLAALKILKAFPNLKCLKLCYEVLQFLVQSNSEIVIPTFDCLEELELFHGCLIEDTLKLLQVLPPLESLSIGMLGWVDNLQTEPLSPVINVSRLKVVKFIRFTGDVCQYGFAKFILHNAKNLERMHVKLFPKWDHSEEVMEKIEIEGRLSKLIPEGSSCVLLMQNEFY